MIFSNFYFAPISYYSFICDSEIYLERYENFPKQTLRNRCIIQSPNGKLNLIIPIKHYGTRDKINQIKISDDILWQKQHWKSLESSYRRSTYFEYYEEELKNLIYNNENNLFLFNLAILEWIIKKFKFNTSINFTSEYRQDYEEILDFRNIFSSKKDSKFHNKLYFQVFSDRFDFMKDLSIIDLICNLGPKLTEYLRDNKSEFIKQLSV